MTHSNGLRLKTLVSALALIGLTACGGGGSGDDEATATTNPTTTPATVDGGGAPVSSVALRGTTTSERAFASNIIEARAQSGESSTGSIGVRGMFEVDSLTGTGPWLVRSDLGNNQYLYSIVSQTGAEELIQNIHSYSDAIARSYFTANGLDIDEVFATTGPISSLPSAAELAAIQNQITSVVQDVLVSYSLANIDLSSIEFAADGTGVDEFLTQNPVIINGDDATIVIFDPQSETQSVASSNLDLNTSLIPADTIAPSAPDGLRALPSASDEITLVWDVADDNVGIARYAIFRDGVEVDTSPFPVFVDGGLAANAQHSYTIVAIDGADNESSPSLSATASPLAAVDTVAPPTPSSVQIDTRSGALEVTWSQTGISDVASFSVNRGNTPAMLSPFSSVTSTFVLDSTVNAGEQFCYTVNAVDASGNSSAPTGVVCATAPGEVIAVGPAAPTPTPPAPVAPPVPGTALTAPLVDVSNLVCTDALPTGNTSLFITSDLTVPAGCYVADRSVVVNEPAQLVLEPGVIIQFGAGDELEVRQGASLVAQGTPTNPIVLTGFDRTPGFWDGVEFNTSNSASNVLDHVQVEFGGDGANSRGGINFNSTTSSPARASVTNTTVRFSAGPGVVLEDGSDMAIFEANRYTDNAVPVQTFGELPELLDTESEYTGNTLDAIVVTRSTISADVMWPNLGIPYNALDQTVRGAWTVAAGTTILFEDDQKIDVDSGGSVTMEGTETAPILLAGLVELPGAWQGISFTSTAVPSTLTNVTIDFAGEADSNDGALSSRASTSNPTRLGLTNVTISNGSAYGIDAEAGTIFTSFENVTVTGNAMLANVGTYVAEVFNNPGNFTGNVEDVIEIDRLSVTEANGELTLANSDVPYFLGDSVVQDALTLGAGATLSMDAGATFRIDPTGSINAVGTVAAPISIVGRSAVAGFWNGLAFNRSNSPLNQFSNVLLADGGDGGGGIAMAANARFDCSTSSPSRLSILNSRIENSAGFGLFIDTTGCLVTVDDATTFTNNANGNTN